MTQSSSLTKVSALIAKINAQRENTVRQRLKEWYKSAEDKSKKENRRASIEVKDCFGSLLKWILELLTQNNQELPLALSSNQLLSSTFYTK